MKFYIITNLLHTRAPGLCSALASNCLLGTVVLLTQWEQNSSFSATVKHHHRVVSVGNQNPRLISFIWLVGKRRQDEREKTQNFLITNMSSHSLWSKWPNFNSTVCVHSCLTLYDHIHCSPSGSSVHGILQARIPKWVVIHSSRGPGIKPASPASPALAGGFFTTEPSGKPFSSIKLMLNPCFLNWATVQDFSFKKLMIPPILRAITVEKCIIRKEKSRLKIHTNVRIPEVSSSWWWRGQNFILPFDQSESRQCPEALWSSPTTPVQGLRADGCLLASLSMLSD